MKILYKQITYGDVKQPSDYMGDTLFHGLRSELGDIVEDIPRLDYLYDDIDKEKLKKIWGKGFSIYGLLPDIKVHRKDVDIKIKSGYYDYIIMPIHNSAEFQHQFVFDEIKNLQQYYPKNKLIIIDGCDLSRILHSLLGQCIYFKRECVLPIDQCIPLSFAIPEEKIVASATKEKRYDFAPLVPAHNSFGQSHYSSYKYDDEESYYEDYEKSYFAYTCKKGGWDCMRHYEILARGCVPFFTDIERCPRLALHNFPKEMCLDSKTIQGVYPGTIKLYNRYVTTFIGNTSQILPESKRGQIDKNNFDESKYWNLQERLLEYTKNNLTTKHLAKYVMENIIKCQ